MRLLDIAEKLIPGKHPTREVPAQYTEEEKKEIRRLMRKHGIDREMVIEEPSGRYFIRDGKKMRFE